MRGVVWAHPYTLFSFVESLQYARAFHQSVRRSRQHSGGCFAPGSYKNLEVFFSLLFSSLFLVMCNVEAPHTTFDPKLRCAFAAPRRE